MAFLDYPVIYKIGSLGPMDCNRLDGPEKLHRTIMWSFYPTAGTLRPANLPPEILLLGASPKWRRPQCKDQPRGLTIETFTRRLIVKIAGCHLVHGQRPQELAEALLVRRGESRLRPRGIGISFSPFDHRLFEGREGIESRVVLFADIDGSLCDLDHPSSATDADALVISSRWRRARRPQ
jgi:hypothetical protein